MQSLLRWSIENSTPQDGAPSDRPPARREDLNPEIIDLILGKPDAELMKEAVAVAVDTTQSDDDRLTALDNLEMLIEQIDNANNLSALKLWEPLQAILTSDASKEIKVATLWVIGTALQNNPSAQDVYLEIKPIPTLLSFLSSSKDSTVAERSKVIYVLSGLFKHNAPALRELSQSGWEQLKAALQDPNITVRRKTLFMLNALLIPTSPVARPSQRAAPLALSGGPSEPNRQPVTGVTAVESQSANLLTPDDRPQDAADPVHPNSHAAHLRDTSRPQTSGITAEAVAKYGIVDTVVESVINPLPYGADGENVEGDADYEEKAVSFLRIYTVLCHGTLSAAQKTSLKDWVGREKARAGGQSQLEEQWSLTSEELGAFVSLL